jgi:hypothetical protein
MFASDKIGRYWLLILFPLLLTVAFGAYLRYSQRYVGACDWYGYYEEARLMKHGTVFLDTELPHEQFPAIIPLGFHSMGGRVVPQYPPGYPLLLAVFGLFDLEFFANSVMGLLSSLLLFLVIKEYTKPWLAALFASAWAFNPMVVYSATGLMSDMLATVCILATFYAYRKGWLWLSALSFGYALAVRPSNLLFLGALAPLLLHDRRVFAFGLRLLLPAALYGAYNATVYGAPWRTGYGNISYDLVASTFGDHAWFYISKTLTQCSATIVILALFARIKRGSDLIFWVLGFVFLFVFYCFWRSGGDNWTCTRFLIPAYPGLYVLAAVGMSRILELIRKRTDELAKENRPDKERTVRIAGWCLSAVLVGVVVALFPRSVDYGFRRHGLWQENKGLEYKTLSEDCAALVPKGSYVGSAEFSGAMRLYTPEIRSFATMDGSFELVTYLMSTGKTVHIIVEPWNKDEHRIRRIMEAYPCTLVREYPLWGGTKLYRLGNKP